MVSQEQLPFEVDEFSVPQRLAFNPKGYTGLYSFHKYWGKKPSETIGFLIEKLSSTGDVVCDPFVGSGVVVLESLLRGRRVIASDLNPIAVELTKFLGNPPPYEEVKTAFAVIKSEAESKINETYIIQRPPQVASHYLWDEDRLVSVWARNPRGRSRIELTPERHDVDLAESFENYIPHILRQPRFFTNSRINAESSLTIRDLFTGRALRNIELILEAISKLPYPLRQTFLLSLTASSGQMSKMVFAITNRGKTTGKVSPRIEVGSWVIGYWRPKLNFEVNVWNCYEGKVLKLIKSLALSKKSATVDFAESPSDVLDGEKKASVHLADALTTLRSLPTGSISLIVTDPPHSDRIPYLELSEMWNVLLNISAEFEKEIVVSNAIERRLNKDRYNFMMREFTDLAASRLKTGGVLALIYNARDSRSWHYIDDIISRRLLNFAGHIPLKYSATSIVQDNRKGSLETDFVLIFTKGSNSLDNMKSIPGWSTEYPRLYLKQEKNQNELSDCIKSIQK